MKNDIDLSIMSAIRSKPDGFIKPYHSQLQALGLFFDCSALFFTLYFSVILWQVAPAPIYSWCGGLSIVVFIFFTDSFEVYSLWRGVSKRKESLRILSAWISTLCVLAVVGFCLKSTDDYSRKVIASWAVAAPALIISMHFTRRKFLTFIRRQGRNNRNYAIVGATQLGVTLNEKLTSMDWLGYKLFGFYDDRTTWEENSVDKRRLSESNIGNLKGNFEKLITDVRSRDLDLVYISLPLVAEKRIQWLLRQLADTTASVFIVPDFNVFDPVRARWNSVQGVPIVSVYDTPFGVFESFVKRSFDLIIASLILLLISIPMLCIAWNIKRTSPGPVIFKQKRYGIAGEEIEVWKFRSMNVVENGSEMKQATKNDSRITPFGAFMRRTSLDELPQFINVLQGRMSIIGPRPHAVTHNEYYRTKVHGYMMRHKVKPGISGLAQVNGLRGETDTHEKMRARVEYDLEYINNWSLLLDFKILFFTIFKGFIGKNVY